MTPNKRVEILEHFANIEHERWSKWQAYLHSKCVGHSDGKGEWVCFSAELYKRWERQIDTPYVELSEAEKESDREQVRPYLDYFTQYHQDLMSEVVEELEGMKMRNTTDDEYVQNIFDQVQRMPLAGTNPYYRAGAEHGYNRAISQAQTIIKSLSK